MDKSTDPLPSKERNTPEDVAMLILGLIVLISSMYWSWNFVGSSGEATSLGTFVAFWLREIIFFGFLGVLLIVGGLAWLARFFNRLLMLGKSEL